MKKWHVTVPARVQKNDDGARDHQQPCFAPSNSYEVLGQLKQSVDAKLFRIIEWGIGVL
jgi:hypothetical protein